MSNSKYNLDYTLKNFSIDDLHCVCDSIEFYVNKSGFYQCMKCRKGYDIIVIKMEKG